MRWTDDQVVAVVREVLADLPPASPRPYPIAKPDLLPGGGYGPHRRWASRKLIWEITGGWCAYCAAALDSKFEVEHVVPRCLGGPDRKINMLPSCYPCNVQKGRKLPRRAD